MIGWEVWIGEFLSVLFIFLNQFVVVGLEDLFDDVIVSGVVHEILEGGVVGYDAVVGLIVDEFSDIDVGGRFGAVSDQVGDTSDETAEATSIVACISEDSAYGWYFFEDFVGEISAFGFVGAEAAGSQEVEHD